MFLLDLYEILPLFSNQYVSYFVETFAFAQPYEKGIPEKWKPGPKTVWWDPKVGLYGRPLGWDPKIGP